ncbi:34071_t:CDS:1, partial [Gigaspora margarita]
LDDFTREIFTTRNYKTIVQKWKLVQCTIYNAYKLENQKERSKTIKSYINRRYKNLKENTTKIIDSILGKHIDAVIFDYVNNVESILIDPREIKNVIKDYFYR